MSDPVRVATVTGSSGLAGAAGLPATFGLLTAMEAGIPVPVPADLVVLVVGERAAAGTWPLWLTALVLQVAAIVGTCALFLLARGPGRAAIARAAVKLRLTERLERASELLERRGRGALALGRATPGLRTVTVVAAGGSSLLPARALLPLIVGSTLFLQAHLVLGYAFGPAAREALERAGFPLLVALALLLVAGAAVWGWRRNRRFQAWTEACCPACLAVAALESRAATSVDARADEERPAVGSKGTVRQRR